MMRRAKPQPLPLADNEEESLTSSTPKPEKAKNTTNQVKEWCKHDLDIRFCSLCNPPLVALTSKVITRHMVHHDDDEDEEE